ncbi:MAG: MBL fold metallo-hydrolase, partial [Flavobacteriales bacterium]
SGHVTLSERTGAPIIFGPNAEPDFDCVVAKDNEEFQLGDVKIKVLHTPGHTMESSTFLLIDENGKDHAIFSGDTLFLGDVGRPDLAQKAAGMTQDELAGILFDSLRSKIMTLPDDTIVYPGHGAGSACGKNMSSETVGSIGHEKANNYALRADMTREEFIQEVTDGLMTPPAYFPMNVMLNKKGYEDVEKVIETGKQALSPEAFEAAANETGAVMLDVRHQDDFAKGHVPNSVFIGLDGDFAPWVGALIADIKQPILLIAENDRVEESIIRLSRVGFDQVIGYLDGGFNSWKGKTEKGPTGKIITAEQLESQLDSVFLLDVRNEDEFTEYQIPDSVNIPLDELFDEKTLEKIPKDKKVV